jgi:hypothetical protein
MILTVTVTLLGLSVIAFMLVALFAPHLKEDGTFEGRHAEKNQAISSL